MAGNLAQRGEEDDEQVEPYDETLLAEPVSEIFAAVICRRISANSSSEYDEESEIGKLELDSHADSPVLGQGAMVVKETGRYVSVRGFTDKIGRPMRVPVVDAVVIYECEFTGQKYAMTIRNGLHIPSMPNHLIPPIMMRLAGIHVNECPKFLALKPSIKNHSIYFPSEKLRLPLFLNGTTSYLPTRMPTKEECLELDVLELTPQTDNWDPHSTSYQEQEESMLDYNGNLREERHEKRYVLSAATVMPATSEYEPRRVISSVIHRSLDPTLLAEDLTARRHCSNVPWNPDQSHQISSVRHTRTDFISVVKSTGAKSDLTNERLAEIFGISNGLAAKTLQCVTRLCPRNTADISLNRRYSNNDRMLRYNRMLTDLFMDTMFAKSPHGKSARGFTCCQVFATEFGWVHPIPLVARKDHIPAAVKKVFKTYGVPPALICDAAREQIFGETRTLCQHAGCELIYLEKGTHNANRAERAIEDLKAKTKSDLMESGAPAVLWCYAIERRAAIMNSIPKDNVYCQGQPPETIMTGQPCDISHLSEFKFYEWVKFKREGLQFPFDSPQLGRCLGPAINQGNRMCQHVLTNKGHVMPIQTLRSLTPAEMNSPFEQEQRKEFDRFVNKKFGTPLQAPKIPLEKDLPQEYDWEDYLDGDTGIEEPSDIPDADEYDDFEAYLHAEVLLPQNGEHMRAAKVVSLVKDSDGKEKGRYDPNPVLNTRLYEVMFPDGAIEQYAANIIAENLMGQVDEEGHRYLMLESIVDHRTDGTESTSRGDFTTRGHELQCQWKDGTTTWLPLKDMKESYPLETAEFAIGKGIDGDAAFCWWIPYVLKKRDRIISSVQHRLVKKSFKYGHEVPNNVQEAHALDVKYGNTRWREAIAKEMKNVRIAFRILEEGQSVPPGFEHVPCHMIFDVKIDGTAKARLVATGCRTSDPEGSTWAGVVSRETVRLALTYAALNDLKVMTADILNAYLTAPTTQKLYTVCGREFGSDYKKKAVITRALYGNKAAGADFRNHLRTCMEHLKYESCKADPDLWLRPAVKDDGTKYYEYVLLYVDDALGISEHPREQLEEINNYFPFKPGSLDVPKFYLGAKLNKERLPNGAEGWGISSSKYIQDAIANLERKMLERGLKLRPNLKAPISSNYRPELDISPELSLTDAAWYQSLIGILRWTVELGRIDIITEVSMLSSCVAMPREGHLQQLFHIFGYLKTYYNARIILDPSYPEIEEDAFPKHDWSKWYKVDKEVIPPNAPEPLGLEFVLRACVDADHAGDKITRRSRTGFIVWVNSAPIHWFSKKQSGVETSTFGSEFLAMKQCCEYLKGLRYKIRMMGIPIEHCSFVSGDNKSVLYNTTLPESTLKKKSHSIAYHYVREGCARDEWRTNYIHTDDNPADICTKALCPGIKRCNKVRSLMYDIYPIKEE